MSIGENIKNRRTAANITQAELAEAVSVRGTKVPSAYLIRDIARLFGCTVDELLCDDAANG